LQMAADIIVNISAQANPAMPPRGKWKQLGDVALEQGDFALARRCFKEAKDLGALFLVHTAAGDGPELLETAKMAADSGIANIAVLCYLLLGECKSALEVLVKANRLPEASFFARTYCPSGLADVVKLWKADLAQVNQAVADSLADPIGFPDLFPDFQLTLAAEKAFEARTAQNPGRAGAYMELKEMLEMDVMEEIKKLTPQGFEKMLLQGGVVPSPAAAPAPVAVPEPVAPEPAAEVVSPVAQQLAPETVVESSPASTAGPEMTPTVPEAGPEVAVQDAPELAEPEGAPSGGGQGDLLDLL